MSKKKGKLVFVYSMGKVIVKLKAKFGFTIFGTLSVKIIIFQVKL